MKIVVDSREQRPFLFARFGVEMVTRGLRTGDYSIDGWENFLCIERKSKSDLFGSVGYGHRRFREEHQRMAEIQQRGFAAVVIECTRPDAVQNPPEYSQLNINCLLGTERKWLKDYGIRWFWFPGRRVAELKTFEILKAFWEGASHAS